MLHKNVNHYENNENPFYDVLGRTALAGTGVLRLGILHHGIHKEQCGEPYWQENGCQIT